MKKINKIGFTLIEMLVVVTVIAILSSVFLVSFRNFRDSAMDSRRLMDLQHIRNYLEIYYTKNRCYPGSGSSGSSGSTACPTAVSSNNDYITMSASLINSDSASSVPNDPISGAGGYTYYYGASADGQSYVLGASLTKGNAAYSDPTAIKVTTYGIQCDSSTLFCIKN